MKVKVLAVVKVRVKSVMQVVVKMKGKKNMHFLKVIVYLSSG